MPKKIICNCCDQEIKWITIGEWMKQCQEDTQIRKFYESQGDAIKLFLDSAKFPHNGAVIRTQMRQYVSTKTGIRMLEKEIMEAIAKKGFGQ